ncbi:MAG: hypothetical protein ABI083_18770 [Lapillicoccus sp.]
MLTKHPELRVLHAYDEVAEVTGDAQDELLARVRQFWAGEATPYAVFELAEFRDTGRRV